MKFPERLASALVELVFRENANMEEAAEAALGMLRTHSPRDVRRFPRLVAQAMKRSRVLLPAHITTPTGTLGDATDAVVSALKGVAAPRAITFSEGKDESLIGGAVVQLGDERVDLSIKGALVRLEKILLEPITV